MTVDHKLKKEIIRAFEPPPPAGKVRFIRSLPRTRVSNAAFVCGQIAYIKKSVWIVSAMILLPAGWGARLAEKDMVWIVSSLTPFLAMLLVTESAKSDACSMRELETAARFSLKSVVMARLGIVGFFDLLLFCALIPLCCANKGALWLQTAAYLFVPYLLTASAGVRLCRFLRGREIIYGCLAAAAAVSGLNIALRCMAAFLFGARYLVWWMLAGMLLLGHTGKELYQMLRRTEGKAWSFALTG